MLLFGSACFWMLGSLDHAQKLVRPWGMEVALPITKTQTNSCTQMTNNAMTMEQTKEKGMGGRGEEDLGLVPGAGHKTLTETTSTAAAGVPNTTLGSVGLVWFSFVIVFMFTHSFLLSLIHGQHKALPFSSRFFLNALYIWFIVLHRQAAAESRMRGGGTNQE